MMTRLLFLLALTVATLNAQTVVPPTLKDKFAQLKVQPMVPTKRDPVKKSYYRQTMTINPQVVIESAATQPIAAARATMLTITMDTREKYVNRKEKYNILSSETLPIPAADKGTKRNFEFKPSSVTYDAYRDASNVGGAVYKWFIFALRDEATKQILHFETNCASLTKHLAAHPEQREKYLSLPVESVFTEEYQ
ncbi:MAG: hypothetical protein RL693_1443 [Verrucomicrobiota bacterium]|jgi:hypothetical protein